MSDDDRLDALMRQTAADEYNRPPEIVPREAMWDAVRHGLGAGDSAPGTGAWSRSTGGSPRAMRRWVYLAAAAVLLLAVGIQLGRMMGRPDERIAQVPTSGSRSAPTDAPLAPPDTLGLGATPDGSADRQIAGEDRSDDGRPRPRPGPERGARPELAGEDPSAAYTVAAVQHLAEVEAMLTSFKGDLGAGRMDAQLAAWAKDLLSTTRLLLDSPAANDPLRRKLFHDLELVLVQIIQLSPGAPARDRDLIKGALTDDQVLTRLRTAIPSGQRGT